MECGAPGWALKACWHAALSQVEEVKCVLRLLPVAFTLIAYYAIYGQTTTMFILQARVNVGCFGV